MMIDRSDAFFIGMIFAGVKDYMCDILLSGRDTMANESYQVEMKSICKKFGGVHALESVNFSVKPGEIHALMGENGAGKSTLIKILAGACSKDEGEIRIQGNPVKINTPKDGMDQGVSVIYQEFALVNDLTVAENIFIDHLHEKGKLINWKELKEKAKKVLHDLGFDEINPMAIVESLSVAHQQVVEICKAIYRNSCVLVLDEPTAVLASSEVIKLFQLIRNLKERGTSIIYISHRLEEVFEISDRITVLKDGQLIGTINTEEATESVLVKMMIGRELSDYFPKRKATIGEVIFRIENITRDEVVKNVSLEVKAGEVLGIGGLVGSGRTETFRAVFGADKMDSGTVILDGKEIVIKSPKDAVKHGIGLLPEDRKKNGVLLNLSVRHNITISCLKNFYAPLGFVKDGEELKFVNRMVNDFKIKTGSIDDHVSTLSGGNQQKVSLSKLIAADSKVLILDEPTRGVDIGAKIEIYKIINELAEQGHGIIVISSEMLEIIGLCDRAIIMRYGEISGELGKEELTEENFINYSMGVQAND